MKSSLHSFSVHAFRSTETKKSIFVQTFSGNNLIRSFDAREKNFLESCIESNRSKFVVVSSGKVLCSTRSEAPYDYEVARVERDVMLEAITGFFGEKSKIMSITDAFCCVVLGLDEIDNSWLVAINLSSSYSVNNANRSSVETEAFFIENLLKEISVQDNSNKFVFETVRNLLRAQMAKEDIAIAGQVYR